MPTFVFLSKVSSEGATQVKSLVDTDNEFEVRLKEQCPGVKRVASYALLGAYDFMHIFEAPDAREGTKVALLANSFGAVSTQTFTAIPFSEFREIVMSCRASSVVSLVPEEVSTPILEATLAR